MFCLENHDCQVTSPINVIRHDVISSQCVPAVALLYARSMRSTVRRRGGAVQNAV